MNFFFVLFLLLSLNCFNNTLYASQITNQSVLHNLTHGQLVTLLADEILFYDTHVNHAITDTKSMEKIQLGFYRFYKDLLMQPFRHAVLERLLREQTFLGDSFVLQPGMDYSIFPDEKDRILRIADRIVLKDPYLYNLIINGQCYSVSRYDFKKDYLDPRTVTAVSDLFKDWCRIFKTTFDNREEVMRWRNANGNMNKKRMQEDSDTQSQPQAKKLMRETGSNTHPSQISYCSGVMTSSNIPSYQNLTKLTREKPTENLKTPSDETESKTEQTGLGSIENILIQRQNIKRAYNHFLSRNPEFNDLINRGESEQVLLRFKSLNPSMDPIIRRGVLNKMMKLCEANRNWASYKDIDANMNKDANINKDSSMNNDLIEIDTETVESFKENQIQNRKKTVTFSPNLCEKRII